MKNQPFAVVSQPGNSSAWWTPRLAGPVIAAAAVRLALLGTALVKSGTTAIIDGDTCTYLAPGRNLLLHGRFVADGAPDLFRTPGYCLFLAVTSLGGLPLAAMANVLLSMIAVILVWRLGRTVFGDGRIALGAAWIFAFEPVSVIWSVFLLSEILFLVLLLLSLERLVWFLRERSLPVLAVGGLWLAAATFVRPVTYYLPVPLALGLFVVLARVPGLRWKAPAVLLISVLPWLAAWQVRNWAEGDYKGFSSVSEVNLYFYIVPEVASRVEHRSYDDVRADLGYSDTGSVWPRTSGQIYLSATYLKKHPEQAAWSQGRRLTFMRSEALRFLRTHYRAYLRSSSASLFRTLFEFGEGTFNPLVDPGSKDHRLGLGEKDGLATQVVTLIRNDPWIAAEKAAFALVLLGLYLSAMRGLILAVRGAFRGSMHNAGLWLLLGTSLYFLGITAAAGGGYARYRLPIMPVVCILAAAGVVRLKTSEQ